MSDKTTLTTQEVMDSLVPAMRVTKRFHGDGSFRNIRINAATALVLGFQVARENPGQMLKFNPATRRDELVACTDDEFYRACIVEVPSDKLCARIGVDVRTGLPLIGKGSVASATAESNAASNESKVTTQK